MNLKQAIEQLKRIQENLKRSNPISQEIIKFKLDSVDAIDVIIQELDKNK